MPKPNPLSQALSQRSAPAQPSETAVTVLPRSTPRRTAPTREGRVLIGGHFAPEVQTALRIMAAEERTTIQALLAEAINTIFAKRGKPEIADIPAQ